MNEMNLNWDDLRLFMSVARAHGLAGAARVTEKSAPTLGRRMVALEAQLGQDLFIRKTQGYDLTAEGEALFHQLLQIESTLNPLIEIAKTEKFSRVKISAGTWVTHYLCKRLVDWPEHLSIPLQFISAEHVLDITHREAVIGIRNKRPSENSLVCFALGWIHFATYAKDDKQKPWAHVLNDTPSANWVSEQLDGSFSVQVKHPRNALDLAIAGTAKVVLPTFIGDGVKKIQRIGNEIPELKHQQWLVTHQDDRHKPEVREVIEWLRLILRSDLSSE